MSVLKAKITIEGVDETVDSLERMQKALVDLRDVLQPVGDFLLNFYKNAVFETEGQIIGESWQKLSPEYRSRKSEKFPGRGILEASGTLREAFDVQTTDSFIRIFNPTPYAKWHQFGGRKMPQRVMLKLDKTRADEVSSLVSKGIRKKLGKVL